MRTKWRTIIVTFIRFFLIVNKKAFPLGEKTSRFKGKKKLGSDMQPIVPRESSIVLVHDRCMHMYST